MVRARGVDHCRLAVDDDLEHVVEVAENLKTVLARMRREQATLDMIMRSDLHDCVGQAFVELSFSRETVYREFCSDANAGAEQTSKEREQLIAEIFECRYLETRKPPQHQLQDPNYNCITIPFRQQDTKTKGMEFESS